jgi:hypothetical protein
VIQDSVLTQVVEASGEVRVKWEAPHDGFSPITQFYVEFKANDGLFYEHNTHCQDVTDLRCDVPMLSLFEEPFLLSFQDLIVARVISENSYG